MRKRTVFFIVTMVFLLSACTPRGIYLFQVEVAGEIREGSILHQPLRGVGIYNSAGERLGGTDERGRFLVRIAVKQGKEALRFQHSDYISHTEILIIDGRSRTSIELPTLELQPAGTRISGRVLREMAPPVLPAAPAASVNQLRGTEVDSEAGVVEGEFNLITGRGERWLAGRLHGQGEIRQATANGLYTVRLRPGTDERQLLDELRTHPEIETVEPNRYAYLLGLVPEDEMYLSQWNLRMVGMEQAWEYAAGEGVVVAVLDSLYLSEHPDLAHHLLPAYDAYNDDQLDLYLGAHGTHVAGIIAAVADQRGIIGAAPHSRILPVRVFKWQAGREIATVDAIVRGIDYAVAHGAQVINMSFGMRDYDPILHEAIRRAYASGVVLVAASGNSGNGQVLYPAAYPEVIAVGAVGPDGKRAMYSQYGAGIELMAPGGNHQMGEAAKILSTYWDLATRNYTWAYRYGTSMAAPHVSAIAAILKSYGISDPDYIRLILRDTARDLGASGYDEETGYGLVDAFAVMDRFQHTYVLFGEVSSGSVQLKSTVAQVQTNGEFELSGVRPGTGRVVGWIDMNHNLIIDAGDYLGQSNQLNVDGETEAITGVQVEMSMVSGEFNAIDLRLRTP